MRPAVALALALAALAACAPLDGLLFNPAAAAADEDLLAAAAGIPRDLIEEHFLPADDGARIDAYLVRHRPDDGTPARHHETGVVVCHGSGGNIAESALWVEALWRQGFTAVVFDYRGYGKSAGRPSEAGLVADARAARALLEGRTELVDPSRTVLYGFSLGAAVAVEVAAEWPARALLLEAPFASLADVLSDNQPLSQPIAWYMDAAFDSAARIGRHQGRLFIAYGGRDITTPAAQAVRLARVAADLGVETETFFRPEAGHLDIRHEAPAAAPGLRAAPTIAADYAARVTHFIDRAVGTAEP